MSKITVRDLGKVGVVKDPSAYQLSLNTWTDARNVRFQVDGVTAVTGQITQLSPLVDYTAGLVFMGSLQAPLWVIGGYSSLSSYDPVSGDLENIARAVGGAYTVSAERRWTGEMFQGIGYLVNGWDYPQMWVPVSGLNLSTTLVQNLPFPVNTSPRILKGYKNFLIALNITEYDDLGDPSDFTVTGQYPFRVQWSHPLAPGEVPTLDDWDFANPAKDCGETDLAENADPIVDFCVLGEIGIIYKESSTWGMQYTQGQKKMRFWPIFSDYGLLAKECVQAFPRGHFAVTQDDIRVHTGSPGGSESIVENRMRKWIFNQIDYTKKEYNYTVSFRRQKEIWFCFASNGSVAPNMALMFNWETGSVAIRDLPFSRHIQYGVMPLGTGASLTWTTV